MTTFTTEDRVNAEPIPFAGIVNLDTAPQGTLEWKLEKLGHVSAGSVSDILATTKSGESKMRDNYKWRLITERITGQVQESYVNDAMVWGIETEEQARITYEITYGVKVTQTGFLKHPAMQWVGASPDGLVGSVGGIEIKCPNTTTHLQTLKSKKAPTKYISQMQMGMWVTNRNWWDFISYDPRLPQALQFFCVRVPRDQEYIDRMEKEVIKFLAEVEKEVQDLTGGKHGS